MLVGGCRESSGLDGDVVIGAAVSSKRKRMTILNEKHIISISARYKGVVD